MASGRKIVIAATDDVLTIDYGHGTFRLLPQSGTRFIAEDSEDPVVFELDADGRVSEVWVEQLCYLEAAAAVRRGDIEAAVTWVSQAATKFPESARAHYNLAKALHGTGRSSEALNQVRAALDIDPDVNGAFELLIRLYLHRFSWVIGIVVLILGWQVIRGVRRRARLRAALAMRNSHGPSRSL